MRCVTQRPSRHRPAFTASPVERSFSPPRGAPLPIRPEPLWTLVCFLSLSLFETLTLWLSLTRLECLKPLMDWRTTLEGCGQSHSRPECSLTLFFLSFFLLRLDRFSFLSFSLSYFLIWFSTISLFLFFYLFDCFFFCSVFLFCFFLSTYFTVSFFSQYILFSVFFFFFFFCFFGLKVEQITDNFFFF